MVQLEHLFHSKTQCAIMKTQNNLEFIYLIVTHFAWFLFYYFT